MYKLHEASKYLLKHWDTYVQMQQVESEINTEYLFPLLNDVKEKLVQHKDFPEDWDIWIGTDDDTSWIATCPKNWEEWNKPGGNELAYVFFGNCNVSEFLADDREERSWFSFQTDIFRKRDEVSIAYRKKIGDVSKEYIDKLEGFEWQYDNSEKFYEDIICCRFIDKMPLSTLTDKDLLISFIVEGMIPLIRVVDQIKNDHFPGKSENS